MRVILKICEWEKIISSYKHLRVRVIHASQQFKKGKEFASGLTSLLEERMFLAKLCKCSKKLTSSAEMFLNLVMHSCPFFKQYLEKIPVKLPCITGKVSIDTCNPLKSLLVFFFFSFRNTAQACLTWEDILVENPTDMFALKMAHDSYFYMGYQELIRDSIARVLPHWKEGMPLYGWGGFVIYRLTSLPFDCSLSCHTMWQDKMAAKET